MLVQTQFLEKQPEYFEDMLYVQFRPEASSVFSTALTSDLGFKMPGFNTLSKLEKGNLIRRITPIKRTEPIAGQPFGVASLLFTSKEAPLPLETDPNEGVSLVELDPSANLEQTHKALMEDPTVAFVSRVPMRYLLARRRKTSVMTTLDTPPAASTLWNLSKIKWDEARALPNFKEARNISIAVLDTGIEETHPDLQNQVALYRYLHPDFPAASGPKDLVGHGTHVSGTICALINNNVGINGICKCNLKMWKIFTDKPRYIPQFQAFIYVVDPIMYPRALSDCLVEEVHVINLSIGGGAPPAPNEQALFAQLINRGRIIVAAMGNDRKNGSPTSYPAAIPGVIAVGATSINDAVADFSNSGNHISIAAPGVAIWSTVPTYKGQKGFRAMIGPGGNPVEGQPIPRETDYAAWQGTSMATPHVTASVALLLATQGSFTAIGARKRLMQTADKVPGMLGANFHPDFGAGRLNLENLLR